MKREIIKNIKILIAAIILSFGISVVYAWTGPATAPPNSNTTTLINTSITSQTKSGALWAGSFLTEGGGYFGSNVGVSVSSPQYPLEVQSGSCIYQFKSNEFYSNCPIIQE
ncbi:MAG: hypothetical protein AAB888_00715 [Patescibacteria group bacterium]